VLDYVLDFTLWLGGDTISTVTSSASGVTVDSAIVNSIALTVTENGFSRTVAVGNAVVLWLSGGTEATPGKVDLRIVTAGARQRDVSIRMLPRSSSLRR
ncbi:MAG: hypothetical protein HYZ18_12800, partial [Pseudogulbenkiania sp.]|nr:hypothetical protein [Pseudogulbenkiania sp.]